MIDNTTTKIHPVVTLRVLFQILAACPARLDQALRKTRPHAHLLPPVPSPVAVLPISVQPGLSHQRVEDALLRN